MKPVHPTITAEHVRAALDYNPGTGVFTRKRTGAHNSRFLDRPVGFIHHTGYQVIKIGSKPYPAHRLAWVHFHGEWPGVDFYIDHINHDKTDNRICNLRKATPAENFANTKYIANKNGIRGIHKDARMKSRPWLAVITSQGKSRYVGYYKTPEEAATAYHAAAVELYGEFAPPLEITKSSVAPEVHIGFDPPSRS